MGKFKAFKFIFLYLLLDTVVFNVLHELIRGSNLEIFAYALGGSIETNLLAVVISLVPLSIFLWVKFPPNIMFVAMLLIALTSQEISLVIIDESWLSILVETLRKGAASPYHALDFILIWYSSALLSFIMSVYFLKDIFSRKAAK